MGTKCKRFQAGAEIDLTCQLGRLRLPCENYKRQLAHAVLVSRLVVVLLVAAANDLRIEKVKLLQPSPDRRILLRHAGHPVIMLIVANPSRGRGPSGETKKSNSGNQVQRALDRLLAFSMAKVMDKDGRLVDDLPVAAITKRRPIRPLPLPQPCYAVTVKNWGNAVMNKPVPFPRRPLHRLSFRLMIISGLSMQPMKLASTPSRLISTTTILCLSFWS